MRLHGRWKNQRKKQSRAERGRFAAVAGTAPEPVERSAGL